ncbi:AAA family ATPase [Psychrosphaera ytuae]|uniref:AAA family ATPase n=1 Tax=Psychrosphaera ytuae TaxID=2820710 RepID=A0A975DC71_9GAMM|nr:AAA family ATPase [Psychrosphaera ytuae]QTH63641.1 AAA family ATPase [Psychrosphaera ytuae]
MYLDYFQLKAEPFNIAPNPNLMYPSQRHQEAIAYLRYGLRGNGGFVMLTGEVGTGKTMVSRAVLTDLPDDMHVAYVLNPTLNRIQLLQTVCDAFQISVADEQDHKKLSDALQTFLVESHQRGESCLLVVDEAQLLDADALEQLRLFTNIETNDKKLLQIILIGQPELQEKLAQRELRQLAQRITARYHLLPLNEQETTEYINHRIRAVGAPRPLFEKKAIKAIYKHASGTPRLINLLADRSLMGAFAQGAPLVSAKVVKQAAKEIIGVEQAQSRWSWLPFVN